MKMLRFCVNIRNKFILFIRTLASKVADMVEAILSGKEAPVNDTSTYNNNVKVVPSYLCEPVFGDASNYKKLLIDSGYYKESELK